MEREPEEVAVALGSNLGERSAYLQYGADGLRGLLEDTTFSRIYETAPCEVEDQPAFLNACCVGRTRLSPRQLLSELQHIEMLAGRRRGGPRYGPRPLDLDLLLYGDRVLDEAGLVVPHPRLRERAFVLGPLAELIPDIEIPASGGHPVRTVRRLAAQAGAEGLELTNHQWEPTAR